MNGCKAVKMKSSGSLKAATHKVRNNQKPVKRKQTNSAEYVSKSEELESPYFAQEVPIAAEESAHSAAGCTSVSDQSAPATDIKSNISVQCKTTKSCHRDLSQTKSLKSVHLDRTFFDAPCLQVAKSLLGTILVKMHGTTLLKAKIVETEAYPGTYDVASHSFQAKRTKRNEAMFMEPGTAYVYNIYGMYQCFNITTRGEGAAVLIRSVEPLEGSDKMRDLRMATKKGSSSLLKNTHICNGPSKLCQALCITKAEFNQVDLCSSTSKLWLEQGSLLDEDAIVVTTRIGINGAGEAAASQPFRFYIRGNQYVSVRDKGAEASFVRNDCTLQQ